MGMRDFPNSYICPHPRAAGYSCVGFSIYVCNTTHVYINIAMQTATVVRVTTMTIDTSLTVVTAATVATAETTGIKIVTVHV